jgi:hypothetical protein
VADAQPSNPRSGTRILDTFGLVSPEAGRYYLLPPGSGYADIPVGLIREQRPDFLVSLDLWLTPEMTTSNWFQREYRLVEQFDASDSIKGKRSVPVYERTIPP